MFKTRAITLLALLVLSVLPLRAESVDEAIAKIASAPPAERVKLMNALKRRLFELNRNQRAAAIARLRATMQSARQSRPAHPAFMPRRHTPKVDRPTLQPPNRAPQTASSAKAQANTPPAPTQTAPTPRPAENRHQNRSPQKGPSALQAGPKGQFTQRHGR